MLLVEPTFLRSLLGVVGPIAKLGLGPLAKTYGELNKKKGLKSRGSWQQLQHGHLFKEGPEDGLFLSPMAPARDGDEARIVPAPSRSCRGASNSFKGAGWAHMHFVTALSPDHRFEPNYLQARVQKFSNSERHVKITNVIFPQSRGHVAASSLAF